MNSSILSTLPQASLADGTVPTTHHSVVVGLATESGWPLLRSTDVTPLMGVDDESTAPALCALLNTVANVLPHGMLSDDRLAFGIGIDAAWNVEIALHTLEISLSGD